MVSGSSTFLGGNVNRSTATPRIAVVDSHTLFAECLCLSLCQRGYDAVRIAPPTRAPSVAALLAPILREHPDVVILNIARSAGWDGICLVQPLALSGVHVVVVTEDVDPARWGQALTLGARVVLSKEAPLASVAAAVRRLQEGLRVLSVEQRRTLVDAYRAQSAHHRAQRMRLERLSVREREILSHLVFGQTVAEIARLSFVSEATVRTQVKSVLTKLEVSSQLAAVALVRSCGWIPCDVVRSHDRFEAPLTSHAAS